MSSQKKQHYVPQFYMKNFSKGGYFNVYNFKKDTVIKNVPIKGQCQTNYYYNKQGSKAWESRLGKLESQWALTIKEIIEGKNKYILTKEDKTALITFAVFQDNRSTKAREAFISKNWEMFKITLNMGTENIIDVDNEKGLKEHFYQLNNEAPALLLDVVDETIDYTHDLEVRIIQYNTQQSLISSDNPIVSCNKIYPNVGKITAGLMIYFPISPSQLVVLFDKKIYKCDHEYTISKNNDEVRRLNLEQLIVSNNLVFGLDEYVLTGIDLLIKKNESRRVKYWKGILSVQSMGTANNKIIEFSKPFLRVKATKSFTRLTKIGNELSKISLLNRDWFPRPPYVGVEFHERLDRKMKMTSIPIHLMNKLDPNEISKFNNLVNEYWISVE